MKLVTFVHVDLYNIVKVNCDCVRNVEVFAATGTAFQLAPTSTRKDVDVKMYLYGTWDVQSHVRVR